MLQQYLYLFIYLLMYLDQQTAKRFFRFSWQAAAICLSTQR